MADNQKPANINNIYFARRDSPDLASALISKAQTFYSYLSSNDYLAKIADNWRFYYGLFNSDLYNGHKVTFTGEQGELVSLPVNHFRNIAQHIYVMITAQRPTMEARSVNTDAKSLAQTYLANGILDYYMREKGLEDAIKTASEMAVVLGSGYIKMEWNATAGEAYDFDPESGQMNYEGDVEFTNISPFDVVFDGTREKYAPDWVMTRTFKNKFDLIAKYPELEDQILRVESKTNYQNYRLMVWSNDQTDDIPVYEFFHKKTESVPNGRYMLFVSEDAILLDTPLPYRTLPLFRMTPGNIMGTPYGYTPMFDIFPLQEAINSLYSTIMSNQNAFGVQSIFIPKGANITTASLEGGMNIIEGNEPPIPIQFTQTPPEVFQFLNMLIEGVETLSGINSVTRGNPEQSLKSGNALALVQSMAIQYISGLQQSYVKLVEEVGTQLINNLKDFAKAPRVAAIVGKNNKTLLKEFTGDDLTSINRVIVDIGNPLAKCLKKDTQILMYDGSIKMVQDVVVGDLIMGPDSGPRTVESTNIGNEMMYDIVSKDKHQNVNYGCNESHILTLRYCSKDGRYGLKQYQEVNISIKEYLSLTPRHQRLFMGFRTGIEFNKKDLDIPAYILGLWLGDGHSNCPALTSMDKELVDEWTKYAEGLNLKIRIQEQPNNKSSVYFITSGEASGHSDRNLFLNLLDKNNLRGNKHIPQNYLTSDSKDRLDLLAGLLDTDGSLINETFIITQKSNKLTENIVFLSRSLGFRTTTRKITVENKEYNKISIGGDTWKIPTKLARKQPKEKTKARNWTNYGIRVVPKEIGTFYGFTLKEEPHFLLGDFTVTHNTTAGRVQMAEQMLQMGLIKTPQEYFQVMNTGKLDVMFEGDMHELILIKQENEKLMEGIAPLVAPTEQHKLHIQEHRSVLADTDMKENADIVKVVMDHIQAHLDALRNTDPALLQILGEQPLPPAMPAGGPPMPPEAGNADQSGGGAPNSPNADIMQQQSGMPQVGELVNDTKLPRPAKPPAPFKNAPTNPANNIPQ